MAWLKFDVTTPEKPEVLAITIAMGWEDPDLTVGKLLKVWRWFDQHTVEGNAANVTAALLDRLIGVTGLSQAMANVGWLVINSAGLTLPNFETHNGKTAKDRALTAIRVAKNKVKTTNSQEGNAASVSLPLPREEKIREEKNINTEPKGSLSTASPLPTCPHVKVIDIFSQKLPELPKPKPELWTGKSADNLRARWKFLMTKTRADGTRYATTETEALDWFERFFDHVSASDWLMGRSGNFKCTLQWLVNAENFGKTVQGNYDNK